MDDMHTPAGQDGSLADTGLCTSCGKNPPEAGNKNRLCGACRQKFIRYPIPVWIWIFAGAVLLLMLISLVRVPAYYSAALHLGRAEKAMDDRRYVTAQRELQQALAVFPYNSEMNGKLLIASGHNFDFATFSGAYNKIAAHNFTDKALLSEMEAMVVSLQSFFPKDSSLAGKIAMIQDSSALIG